MPTKGRAIRPSTEPDAAQQYQPGSLSIFEFTPEDVKANQHGHSNAPIVSFQRLGA